MLYPTAANYWKELDERGDAITELTLTKDGDYTISPKSKQALIDLRDIAEEEYSTPCRVTLIVADGHSEIVRAIVDGYINWRKTSTIDVYKYALLVCGNIFTCQSDDATLDNALWTKSSF